MNKNVLIVEDEGVVSLEIQENLERLGHRVLGIVDTGEEAVTVARDKHPDLILMDVRLKGRMDGVEAASLIRKQQDVPVVFLTAYSGDETLRRAMVTEPYAYLLKPIQEQQLASALRMAWYRHEQESVRNRNLNRFTSILKALPHAVIVTDRDLKVRYLNSRAKKLIGLTKYEAWGRPLNEILVLEGPSAAQHLRESVANVINDGGSASLGENYLRSHLDESKVVLIDVSTFVDRNSEVIGGLLVVSEASPSFDRTAEALVQGFGTSEFHPPATEIGQLRSFLEIEIIRLALSDQSEDSYVRGYTDGQLSGNKRLLQLFFGDEAVREIEAIIPDE